MTWQELRAQDGSVYYYNSSTQQSVREKPEELFTTLDRYLYKTQWRQNFAEGAKVYYYHLKSGESRWELPEEVKELMESDEKSTGGEEKDEEEEHTTLTAPTTASTEDSSTSKYHNDSILISKKISVKSPQEAEEIFIEMLREEKVDSTWSFSRILDFFIKDPRYWVIEDSLQKKQVFESYLNNRSKAELMKESTSIEKFKASFIDLLKSKPEIVYYTRWKTAKRLIQDEPIYAHSVIGEKVKKQTFEEYVDSLRKEADARDNKSRDQALNELKEYFKTMNLNINSTWDKTIEFIKNDKRFEQNKHFEVLNQLDLINLYHEHLIELQKEQRVRLQEQSRANYRLDRRARDEFKKLLKELKEAGLLRADTTWVEIVELIEDDDRFIQMLGRNGSTPLELFNDVIEEEELLIRGKKAVVEQVLLHNNFVLDDDTDLEKQKSEIMDIVSKDGQTKEFDEDTMELIYAKLIKDVTEQKEKDRFAKERRLRRQQEEFKSMLRAYVITESTKWEEIKPKISQTEEYIALGDDQTRQQTYDKYVSRLIEKRKEEEQRKEEEVKRIIASATNARRENNKKRPLPTEPVEELDY